MKVSVDVTEEVVDDIGTLDGFMATVGPAEVAAVKEIVPLKALWFVSVTVEVPEEP